MNSDIVQPLRKIIDCSLHSEKEGTFIDAYQDVLENGGQLFQGNGKDSPVTVVRGKKTIIYWQKNSRKRGEILQLCSSMNIDPYAVTGGRIARFLLDEILSLPYEKTFWNKRYRSLAVSGHHWHYYHVVPWQFFYGCEFDIKSAYFASLMKSKTLLYMEGKGYVDDGGAIESLSSLIPSMPKWFRLQLLGVLASWQLKFLSPSKKPEDNGKLVIKSIPKIQYNAAFNCVHRAILRNYKIMENIHKIGGEHIKRMHTDSFFLSWECPVDIEAKIFEYLAEKGCEVSVKASGKAFFYDLNTGFIGKKFVGSKIDVIELMRSNGQKMQKTNTPVQVMDRFGNYIKEVEDSLLERERILSGYYEPSQLILFDN